MFMNINYHENKAYHIKWCKIKNCENCKKYIEYLKTHNEGVYNRYLSDSNNWK